MMSLMRWRRGYDEPPPPISASAQLQRAMCHDERYRRRPCSLSAPACGPSLDVVVPRAETLRQTCERVEAVWEDTIKPALVRGERPSGARYRLQVTGYRLQVTGCR